MKNCEPKSFICFKIYQEKRIFQAGLHSAVCLAAIRSWARILAFF